MGGRFWFILLDNDHTPKINYKQHFWSDKLFWCISVDFGVGKRYFGLQIFLSWHVTQWNTSHPEMISFQSLDALDKCFCAFFLSSYVRLFSIFKGALETQPPQKKSFARGLISVLFWKGSSYKLVALELFDVLCFFFCGVKWGGGFLFLIWFGSCVETNPPKKLIHARLFPLAFTWWLKMVCRNFFF